MNTPNNKSGTNHKLSDTEQASVEKRLRPRVPMLYEIIRQEGESELNRPLSGLWWSGVAAGLCIGFSMIAEGLLQAYLPDTDWRPLVENFGYSVGFLIVVLGRQQLFTENTITAVLPVMAEKSLKNFLCMLRLWGVVLAANIAGAFLFAAFCSLDGIFSAEVQNAFSVIARHLMDMAPMDMFWRGIVAGWLIATLVWILPNCEGGEVLMITLITYLIALGDFTHIIAGSVEAFWLMLNDDLGIVEMFAGFFLPTLFGNVVGGTLLFAMISYAQVQDEI